MREKSSSGKESEQAGGEDRRDELKKLTVGGIYKWKPAGNAGERDVFEGYAVITAIGADQEQSSCVEYYRFYRDDHSRSRWEQLSHRLSFRAFLNVFREF